MEAARTQIAFIAPIPGHAADPAVRGIKAVRDRLGLDWDVALVAPDHWPDFNEHTWVVARIHGDFKHLSHPIPPERCISLIPTRKVLTTPPAPLDPNQPTFCCTFNNQRFGELAARHAAERGYQNAVTIASRIGYHRERQDSFAAMCEQLGIHHQMYAPMFEVEVEKIQTHFFAWLDSLPKPLVIYQPIDDSAAWLRDRLLERGVAIPNEIALIGTGDHITCTNREPAMTSVAYPWQQMGEAAAMNILHRLRGNRNPPVTNLQPSRVVARASTKMISIHDPVVKRSIVWMKKHLACPTPAEAAAVHVGLNAKTLATRFRKAVGTTPKQMHDQLRIEKAEQLLSNPQLTLQDIAKKAGFADAVPFSVAFKRRRGISPGAWRKAR